MCSSKYIIDECILYIGPDILDRQQIVFNIGEVLQRFLHVHLQGFIILHIHVFSEGNLSTC